MRRWLALEYSTLNSALVTKRKTLSELLDMDEPKIITRNEKEHRFDVNTLFRIADVLSNEQKSKLKIPITFHSDVNVEDSLYIDDELAVLVLMNLDLLQIRRKRETSVQWCRR